MEFINTIIGTPLGYIMWLCYTLIKNYGIAIILFTLVTKVLMFPLNMWVQKNSIKMVRLKPQLNEIAAAFVGDRDRIAEKQLALYKQENYKPLAGIIPMLIQIPIILGLISVVYNPLQHLLHLDANVINAFVGKAADIFKGTELGSTAQLKVIELVNDPSYTAAFSSLSVPGAASAVASIKALDLNFLGLNLSYTPTISLSFLTLIPILSGGSAFLLSASQNKINVLQREANWLGRWGMAIFLTLFSLYFAFIVPGGVGVYWVASNLMAILIMLIVNLMYPPKKYIDYDALEKSKIALEQSKEVKKALKITPEQKNRAKTDYKKFFDLDNIKKIVFYSEKSGFYKYFKGVIEYIIKNSDTDIHYVTSDPGDAVFKMNNPRLIPYYIDDNRLIPLFMKMDSDIMVMTTPDLQQFHLKRSLVKRDVEYIYMFHGLLSTNMVVRKGSYDHYDTILCGGQHQIDELRECEKMYDLTEKNLVPCGYGLLDELIENYRRMEKTSDGRKRVLIAPSYQEESIMDVCLDKMLKLTLGKGYVIIVRPHPQYIRHNPGKVDAFKQKYQSYIDKGDLIVESDFSSNTSVYTSDILITDWSGIAYEFSFTTEKPSIFINTPMKVLNPDYDKYENKPLDITLRDKVGVSIEPDALEKLPEVIADMLQRSEAYKEKIQEIRGKYVFNLGCGSEAAGKYILSRLQRGDK